MKLIFKQRFFSWFDSYDVFSENGETLYTVKGQLSWGHCQRIFDNAGNYMGTVKQRILTFLPKFEMYCGEEYVGCISREFTLFKPKYNIDCNGWTVDGNFFEWDYSIFSENGNCIATITKEIWNWTDTYIIDVTDPKDALQALMLVIAIDCEKCSRDNH